MATYDKLIYDIPAYQEGNEADFEFDLDDAFPIGDVTDITFQVRNSAGEIIITKMKSVNSAITLTDRTVKIPFTPADTKEKSGKYQYEIDFVKTVSGVATPFATIGGTFTINAEINKL